jgi:hypothetical protein
VTAETLLRLALVPAAVWAASLAARRWGHTASGYLGGLPLIGGPITLFLALDLGVDFAARSALFTLAAIAAQAAHLLAVAHVGRRRGWAASLACGWAAFAVASCAIAFLALSPVVALAMALVALAAAWRWLPAVAGPASPPAVPPVELRLRVACAFLLAAAILWSAPLLGPVASGILLSVPITGSIMPPFTLALYGADALARLARGFVVGLTGFAAFFFVLAAGLPAWGVGAAFCAAVAAALAGVYLASHLVRARR